MRAGAFTKRRDFSSVEEREKKKYGPSYFFELARLIFAQPNGEPSK